MSNDATYLCLACKRPLVEQYLPKNDIAFQYCANGNDGGALPCPRYGIVTCLALVVKSETTTEIIRV